MSEKKAKLSDSDAKAMIAQYMKEQNRPYNDKMVFENLHGAISKTTVLKLMETLVTEETLCSKEFGKSKIYWINQKVFPETPKEKIAELDARIKVLEVEFNTKQAEARVLVGDQNAMGAQLSDEEIIKQIAEFEKKTTAQAKKLAPMKGNGAKVSRDDFERTEATLQKALTEWRKRRGFAMAILNDVGEGTNKTNKELKKLIGFEDDGDAGVDLQAMSAKYPKKNVATSSGPPTKKAKTS